MGLLEEAKRIVNEGFGQVVADQLNIFEDPEKDPDEFLKECIYFIGKLIGDEAAEKKFQPLTEKYAKAKGGTKFANRYSEIKRAQAVSA